MTDEERNARWQRLADLSGEAQNDRMARRIESAAPASAAFLVLPPGVDPKDVRLEGKMLFSTDREDKPLPGGGGGGDSTGRTFNIEDFRRPGDRDDSAAVHRAIQAALGRSWRHHVWDMLKDAWAFCFGRKP